MHSHTEHSTEQHSLVDCARRKPVAAALRQLRDRLHQSTPSLAKPTSNMIEHLLANCPSPLFKTERSDQALYRCLCHLEYAMSPSNSDENVFTRAQSEQALFPNEELFDEQDAFMFAKSALHLLRQSTRSNPSEA